MRLDGRRALGRGAIELAGRDGDPRRLEVDPARVDPGPPRAAAARDRRDPPRLRLRLGRRRRLERARARHGRAPARRPRRLRRAAARTGSRSAPGSRSASIVTDTFGRAWRVGIANVAIGAAGIEVLRDLPRRARPGRLRAALDGDRDRRRDRRCGRARDGQDRAGAGRGRPRASTSRGDGHRAPTWSCPPSTICSADASESASTSLDRGTRVAPRMAYPCGR